MTGIPAFPRVETRFGPMFVLQGDTVIGRSLRLYGEFAGAEVDSILALARPGDHVLDLGANIGFHTLALARRVGPEGRVTSVEPQRYCFQLLCANVTLNQLTNVQCLRAAAGDAAGFCTVPVIDPLARVNAGATEVMLSPGAEGVDRVSLVTVDSLDLERCDLVKIDTEGFEVRVLEGAMATLSRCRPVLYVEVHDREKLKNVVALLRPLEYRLFLHTTQFFRAGNPNGESVSIFSANAGGHALLAVRADTPLPDDLPGELRPIA